jgi:hypothetical protein
MQVIKDKLADYFLGLAEKVEESKRVGVAQLIDADDDDRINLIPIVDADAIQKSTESFDSKLSKALNIMDSNSTVINNYQKLLFSNYRMTVASIPLKETYEARIAFKCRDDKLTVKLPHLRNCIIGDIEIDMNIPDDTEVSVRFEPPYRSLLRIENFIMETANATFKSKKATFDRKLVDFTQTYKSSVETSDLFHLFLDIRKTAMESKLPDVTETFEFITECITDYRLSLYHNLTVTIRSAHKLDLDCELHAKFKCKYVELKESMIDALAQSYINTTDRELDKKTLRNVASLY